jgi:hypothetical protein
MSSIVDCQIVFASLLVHSLRSKVAPAHCYSVLQTLPQEVAVADLLVSLISSCLGSKSVCDSARHRSLHQ